jgi:mRNA interferase MazF
MPEMPKPSQGEVWTVVLDPVKGHEQGGVRPALVISNDRFNLAFQTLLIVVPLTRTDRGMPTQVRVDPPEGGLSAPSYIMCEQVRAVSILRFRKKRGSVSENILRHVEGLIPWLIERSAPTDE